MSLLPPFISVTISQIFGVRGRAWLADLPAMVKERCDAWDLSISGRAFLGGTHSYVAPVIRADGSPAVLKLPVRDEENMAEPSALRHYDGDGAVMLFEYDHQTGAMLLEAAVPGRPLVAQDLSLPHREGLTENRVHVRLACHIYQRLWRVPVESDSSYPSFPLAADVVSGWRREIPRWSKLLSRWPGISDLIAESVTLLDVLSKPDGPEGIANRDTHLGNIVSAQREPWLLIDPKPVLAERAFDAGFLLGIQLENSDDTDVHDRISWTAEWLDVDPRRARAWALLRLLENAGWAAQDNEPRSVNMFLTAADALKNARL